MNVSNRVWLNDFCDCFPLLNSSYNPVQILYSLCRKSLKLDSSMINSVGKNVTLKVKLWNVDLSVLFIRMFENSILLAWQFQMCLFENHLKCLQCHFISCSTTSRLCLPSLHRYLEEEISGGSEGVIPSPHRRCLPVSSGFIEINSQLLML